MVTPNYNFPGVVKKKKNRRKGFFFSYSDIAKLTGYSVGTLKNKVANGTFNPTNLESLTKFVMMALLKKEAAVPAKPA